MIFSDHRYPGQRTLFEVEFPHVAAGSAWGPSGLRVLPPRRADTAAVAGDGGQRRDSS